MTSDERPARGVARVELRVSDPGRTAELHESLSGLVRRADGADRIALGAPDGGPDRLVLIRAARPGRAARRAAGLFHVALRYPGRAALAEALRRIAAAPWPLSGASDHGVSEALYLDDPDGLGLELYRDRPRAEWPAPERGERVRMATLPLDLPDLLAEPPEPAGAAGIDVGHVHLRTADVDAAIPFWTDALGLALTTRLGSDAAFFAWDDYHHHVATNAWGSRGAPLEPPEGPGIDRLVLAVPDLDAARERLRSGGAPAAERDGGLETRTPDGVRVRLEAG